MDDAVVALLGAVVGAVGSGCAAYLTARMARRQSQEQLAAQRAQFERQVAEQCRQFEAQVAENKRQFEAQTAEQYRQFEAQSRADHVRSRRDYRADAYKAFLRHASAVKGVLAINGSVIVVTDASSLVEGTRGMEAALGDVQVEGPRTVSDPAERMLDIAKETMRRLEEWSGTYVEAGLSSRFRAAFDSFTDASSRALNDESLPDMKPSEAQHRWGHMARMDPKAR